MPQMPPWANPGLTWAPNVSYVNFNGSYYHVLFFVARDRDSDKQAVGVATSQRPEGPYQPVSTKPLINQVAARSAALRRKLRPLSLPCRALQARSAYVLASCNMLCSLKMSLCVVRICLSCQHQAGMSTGCVLWSCCVVMTHGPLPSSLHEASCLLVRCLLVGFCPKLSLLLQPCSLLWELPIGSSLSLPSL